MFNLELVNFQNIFLINFLSTFRFFHFFHFFFNCGHYFCLPSTKIVVTMFACHLHNSSGMCLHLARTNHVSAESPSNISPNPLEVNSGMPTELPSTNPWGPGDCGRDDCIICKQQDEKPQDCRRRNVLYENQCQVCKVDMKDGEKMNDFLKDGKGRYIGETSRSIYERSQEHQRDKENQEDDSHQVKHWRLDHPELYQHHQSLSSPL